MRVAIAKTRFETGLCIVTDARNSPESESNATPKKCRLECLHQLCALTAVLKLKVLLVWPTPPVSATVIGLPINPTSAIGREYPAKAASLAFAAKVLLNS